MGRLKRGQDDYYWFQFYVDKWMGDLDLMSTSLAAQGLWMQLMCVMFKEGTPRGVVRDDARDLARRLRLPEPEVKALLKELEKSNVFSRGAEVIDRMGPQVAAYVGSKDIVCRYMFREWWTEFCRSAAGRLGGMKSGEARRARSKSNEVRTDLLKQNASNANEGPSKTTGDKVLCGNGLTGVGAKQNGTNGQATLSLESKQETKDRRDLSAKPNSSTVGRSARGGEAAPVGSMLAGVEVDGFVGSPGWVLKEVLTRGRWSDAQGAWWEVLLERLPPPGVGVLREGVEQVARAQSGRPDVGAMRNVEGYLLSRVYDWARGAGWSVESCPSA